MHLNKAFLTCDDTTCWAGKHVIVDVFGIRNNITDADTMENLFNAIIKVCGATKLGCNIHEFNNGGITGVALLGESHISVHTWPENNYAAFDIFMCKGHTPENAIQVLEEVLQPIRKRVQIVKRGIYHVT